MTIGKKIKHLRELRSLTQEEMADLLHMSQANYSKIERDEIEVKMSRLEEISKILNIDLTDLINFDEHNFFVIQNNDTITGISGTINNHYQHSVTDKERVLYEDKIRLLEEKIQMLEAQLKQIRKNQQITYAEMNDPGSDSEKKSRNSKKG